MTAEEFCYFKSRLLTTNLTKNETATSVFLLRISIEIYCPCFQLTWSICSIWVMESTLLTLTQCYSNIFITTYIFLLKTFPGSTGFSWQLGGKGRICSKRSIAFIFCPN